MAIMLISHTVGRGALAVEAIYARPTDLLEVDYAGDGRVAAGAAQVGLTARVRLGRYYYVRVNGSVTGAAGPATA
jgi:hypothetical protein